MSNSPPRLTLGAYGKQVASQANEAEPLIPHSCEHCDKLVVRLPDACSETEKEKGLNAPIEGLCRTLIFDSVGNGCLFLEHCRTQIGYMEPKDVDDAGGDVGEDELEGLHIEESEEADADEQSDKENEDDADEESNEGSNEGSNEESNEGSNEESNEGSNEGSNEEGDEESTEESDEAGDDASEEQAGKESDASDSEPNSDESDTDSYDETYTIGAPDDTIVMRVKISLTDIEADQETQTEGRHPHPVWTATLIHPYDPLSLGIAESSDVPSWLRPYRIWKPSSATNEAFIQARSWYQECHKLSAAAVPPNPSNAHDHCQPAPRDFVPTRLVCIPSTDDHVLSIVNTRGLGYVPWCSLSYCWGGPQLAQSTTINFPGARRDMMISELPRTILDAVLVASELGIPYLWIDSLCIIQNDPDDVEKELRDMVRVYKHAVLTIAASNASAVFQGFLSPRTLNDSLNGPPFQLRCQTSDGNEGHVLLKPSTYAEELEPLNSRAWVMQEDLLSPRLLVYGSKSSRWVCKSRSYRDSYLRRDSFDNRGAAALPQANDWKGVVTAYTACQLSFKTDTLNAIAAIAEDFGNLRLGCGGDQYLAGLWRPRIEHLCTWWFTDSAGNKRPKAYRAPSWSWASVDSTHSAFFKDTKIEHIIDVTTTPASALLPYGNAQSGVMKVHCKIACFSLKREPSEDEPLLTITNADEDHPQTLITNLLSLDAPDDDFEDWDSSHVATSPVWMLRSSELRGVTDGILLQTVDARPDAFRRVGICDFQLVDYKTEEEQQNQRDILSIFDNAELRTISIE